jgi:hypothetical protein
MKKDWKNNHDLSMEYIILHTRLQNEKTIGISIANIRKKSLLYCLSVMSAFCLERRRIPDRPVHTIERTGHQFDRHERLIRTGEVYRDPKGPGSGEPESRVISRMADNEHGAVPEMAAGIESFFKKGCTNTLALKRRVHAKGGKGPGRNASLSPVAGFDGNWGEEHMADDPVVMDGDKGEIRGKIPIMAQGIDKPGFAILGKSIIMQGKNIPDIGRSFRADKK